MAMDMLLQLKKSVYGLLALQKRPEALRAMREAMLLEGKVTGGGGVAS